MHFKKIFVFIALSLAIGFSGCAQEKVEAPKQRRITKTLVPPKAEVKGQNFLVELTNLQVVTIEDVTSKEIVETPSLQGRMKITNKSQDILDIQAVTLEYLDEAGKRIDFQSTDKIAKSAMYFRALKPEENVEGSLEVTIPRNALKEKALATIQIDLVYVSSPLKRDTVTLSEKVE